MKKRQVHPKNPTQQETAELFQVSPVTVFNWVKEGFLAMDEHHRITAESIRQFRLKHAGKTKLQYGANKLQKDGHDSAEVEATILKALDEKKFDMAIGDRYQSMLSESYKNKEGIFYTPMAIVEDMMKDFSVKVAAPDGVLGTQLVVGDHPGQGLDQILHAATHRREQGSLFGVQFRQTVHFDGTIGDHCIG